MEWLLALNEHPHDMALQRALEQWLGESAAHRQAFRAACDLWGLTGRLEPMYAHWWRDPPQHAATETGVAAAVVETDPAPMSTNKSTGAPADARTGYATEQAAMNTRGPSARRRWLAAALAAALAAVLLSALPLDFAADFRTAPGENRAITLEDHSRVQLNTDSALATDFSPAQRSVALLRGEAFFAVTADRQRPFVVRVGDARVRVVGTRFNVRSRGGELRVDVEQGHVVVDDPAYNGSLQLLAGDSVVIDHDTRPMVRRTSLPAQRIAAWRHGQLIVENWPVAKVIDEIGRYRRGIVILLDAEMAREPVSGVFNLTQPDDALRALMQPFSGHVRDFGPYLTTVSR